LGGLLHLVYECAALYRPRFLPTVRKGFVAEEGTLWIRAGSESSDSVTWLALGPRGQLTTMIRTPATLDLLAASGQSVYGVRTDSLGMQALLRYRIRP
jgi:hypothetical protein